MNRDLYNDSRSSSPNSGQRSMISWQLSLSKKRSGSEWYWEKRDPEMSEKNWFSSDSLVVVEENRDSDKIWQETSKTW
jgi:hypothetical protein